MGFLRHVPFCREKNQKFRPKVDKFEAFDQFQPNTHQIAGAQVGAEDELRPLDEIAGTELTAVNIQARVMDLEGQGALVSHKPGPWST